MTIAHITDTTTQAGRLWSAPEIVDGTPLTIAPTAGDILNHPWHELEPMGFDRRFKRMWEFYLAYCEAGFRTGSIDVVQTALVRR